MKNILYGIFDLKVSKIICDIHNKYPKMTISYRWDYTTLHLEISDIWKDPTTHKPFIKKYRFVKNYDKLPNLEREGFAISDVREQIDYFLERKKIYENQDTNNASVISDVH